MPIRLLSLMLLAAPLAAQQSAHRFVRSDSLPRIQVDIRDSTLAYLGRITFDVRGLAEATQFIFGEVRDGRLCRAAIVHFEHFYPSNSSYFGYPSSPAVTVGRHQYLHQNWAIEGNSFFGRRESQALLGSRGIAVDSLYLSDRIVRVVSDDRKHEFILFYLESAASLGRPVTLIQPSSAGDIPPDVARELAERAARLFLVRDE